MLRTTDAIAWPLTDRVSNAHLVHDEIHHEGLTREKLLFTSRYSLRESPIGQATLREQPCRSNPVEFLNC